MKRIDPKNINKAAGLVCMLVFSLIVSNVNVWAAEVSASETGISQAVSAAAVASCQIPKIATVWSGRANECMGIILSGGSSPFNNDNGRQSIFSVISNPPSGVTFNANMYGAVYDGNNRLIISSYLDNTWGDHLNFNSAFNTVYDCNPGAGSDGVFEVGSVVDEIGPFFTTQNPNAYFFSYDSMNDGIGNAVTLKQWVDYLNKIKDTYGRIGRLSIACHGNINFIGLSDACGLHYNNVALDNGFSNVANDAYTRLQLKRLRTILAPNATILVWACLAGKGAEGNKLIQEIADLTLTKVYANSESTAEPNPNINEPADFSLDVEKSPQRPAAPSNMTAVPLSTSSISLHWNDSSDNETGFLLYRHNGSGWSLITTLGANETSYIDENLTANTVYRYSIKAYNSAGQSPWLSQYLHYVETKTSLTKPNAPTNLKISAVPSGSTYLTWMDNSDNEIGFYIWRYTNASGGKWTRLPIQPAGANSFTDTGLESGKWYSYCVQAINYNGSSNSSHIWIKMP